MHLIAENDVKSTEDHFKEATFVDLQELSIAGSSLDNEFLASISLKFPLLRSLILFSNSATSRGVLRHLTRMKNLSSVNVDLPGSTEEEKQRVQNKQMTQREKEKDTAKGERQETGGLNEEKINRSPEEIAKAKTEVRLTARRART